jgi:hypothetical protein
MGFSSMPLTLMSVIVLVGLLLGALATWASGRPRSLPSNVILAGTGAALAIEALSQIGILSLALRPNLFLAVPVGGLGASMMLVFASCGRMIYSDLHVQGEKKSKALDG